MPFEWRSVGESCVATELRDMKMKPKESHMCGPPVLPDEYILIHDRYGNIVYFVIIFNELNYNLYIFLFKLKSQEL